MSSQQGTDHRILDIIVRSPGTMMDDIALKCMDLTWNQVFVVIDRLTREGVLTMSPKGRGQYALTFPTAHGTTLLPTSILYRREQANMPARTSRQMKEKEPS